MKVELMGSPPAGRVPAGVDEAGRGPVIGPLVVCGFTAREGVDLGAIGADDSKTLAPGERSKLFDALLENGQASIIRIEAIDLDELMGQRSLNEIEIDAFAIAISSLRADEAIVDAIGPAEALSRRLSTMTGLTVRAEHKADANHPVVGAASIIAKVIRDRRIDEIAQELDADIGSGYPSDPTTKRFLDSYVQEHGSLPPHARRRWKTSGRLLTHKLDEYF